MELIIVLAVALIILGPKRLPDAGRALGTGIRNLA
jgi:sec-independent protein translocase protein TatA